jgi:ribosome recycling factor
MDIEKEILEASKKMVLVIDHLESELKTINTGRASSLLVEGVDVDCYGSKMPIKQIASIATPSANQITITPWDNGLLANIETAIRNSDVGMAPTNDGKSIRLALPPMTEDRRNELIKMVSRFGEEAKISLRVIRGDFWDHIQKAERQSIITEDDRDKAKKRIDELTSEKNNLVSDIIEKKQAEVSSV